MRSSFPWLWRVVAVSIVAAGPAVEGADRSPRAPDGRLSPLLDLRITEVMYHPLDDGAEFLELKNLSGKTIGLAGIHLSDGVRFTFPPDATVLPGAHAVLVESESAFAQRYPGVPVHGVYSGRLSNAGETVTLSAPDGRALASLTYDDDAPWPTEADGLGNSLVIRDTEAADNDPFNWCASAELGGSPGADEPRVCPPRTDPTDAVFEPDRVLQVEVELADADWQALRLEERSILDLFAGEDCLEEPFGSPFTYFPATVTVDGTVVDNVGFRKKGFLGSLSRDKPSLKIRFDELTAGLRYSGLRRMTLNNCQQDRSYVNQCLGYQLFAAAGVPAPRCNFAVVAVNGQMLGVYAHVESVRERFIARHFDRNDGHLYEGTISDFRPEWVNTFELKSGRPAGDRSDLEAMVAAMAVPDSELTPTLETLLDLDAFLSFWAMEVLVGHWDGYTGNTNNFYLYHDPTSDRLHFVPWGADALFRPEAALFPEQEAPAVQATAVLPRRLYIHGQTQQLYVDRVLELLDRVWHEPDILAEIDRMRALVLDHLHPDEVAGFDEAVQGVRDFVSARRGQVLSALVPEPPLWDQPLRDPLCFTLIGNLEGGFDTTWGTMDSDPFQAGTGTVDAILHGMPVPILAVGAVAGPGADPENEALLALVAALWDGTFAIILVETHPDLVAADSTLQIDQPPTLGLFLHLSPATDFEPQLIGLLANGTLHLEQAGTTPGSPVRGTLTADVYEGFF